MKICLVIPPACSYGYYARFPALGLLYVAAVLEQLGHKVTYLDCILEGMSHNDFYNYISELKPDLVGISVFSGTRFSAFECARIAKRISKNITVVCGGPHATVLSKEILEEIEEVDVVMRGEAEYIFREYLNHGPAQTKGITYRQNGKIIFKEDAEPISNLDELPFPAWHLVNMKKYFSEYIRSFAPYKNKPLMGIITGRGCSRRCVFCAAPKLSPRIRRHSPQYISRMVKFLQNNYGIKDIYFLDDTFTDNQNWIEALKNEFEKNNIFIPFQCQGVATLTNKTIDMLKEMGCYYIYIGAESGSDKVLKAMNKAIRVKDFERSIKYSSKKGLMVHSYWLVGMPEEDSSDLAKTLKRMRSLPHNHYSVAVLDIYPGTKLSESLINNSFWRRSASKGNIDGGLPCLANRKSAEVAACFLLLNAHLFCFFKVIKYIILLLHENLLNALFSYFKQVSYFIFNIKYLPFKSDLLSNSIGALAVFINRIFSRHYLNFKSKLKDIEKYL